MRVSVITDHGRSLLDRLDAEVRDAAIASLGGLGKADLKRLETLLAAVAPATEG